MRVWNRLWLLGRLVLPLNYLVHGCHFDGRLFWCCLTLVSFFAFSHKSKTSQYKQVRITGCNLKISPQNNTEDNGKRHKDTQITNTPRILEVIVKQWNYKSFQFNTSNNKTEFLAAVHIHSKNRKLGWNVINLVKRKRIYIWTKKKTLCAIDRFWWCVFITLEEQSYNSWLEDTV